MEKALKKNFNISTKLLKNTSSNHKKRPLLSGCLKLLLKVGKQNLIIINLLVKKFILSSKTPGALRVVDIQSANEKIILKKNIPIIDLDECSSESNPDGLKN